MTKTTTIAACALLATTILNSNPAKADAGKAYLSLTGEYISSASADGNLTAGNVSVPGTIDYKDGWGGLAAIGYHITDNVRTELELGYRKLNGDTSSVTISGTTYTVNSSDVDSKAFSTMANIYFNLPTEGNLSPYLGLGAGWAHEQDEGANALGYQVMTGIDYKLSGNSTVFAGYRFFGTTDFENKYNIAGIGAVTEKASVKAHAIDIGYRFSF